MTDGVVLRVFGDRALVRCGEELLTCRPKGRLRAQGLLAGDRVRVDAEHIAEVLGRENALGRPPVANVRVLLAVAAVREPAVTQADLERMLLQAEAQRLQPIVVLNKADLAREDELARYERPYRIAGYPVVRCTAVAGDGVAELLAHLPVGIAALAGPSGVGKSSLLRRLAGREVAVGELSERLHRGRHTTRAATIFELGQGRMLADTPGFSALELPDLPPRALPDLYPELRRCRCRFSDCLHRGEPGCALSDLRAADGIDPGRYERYLQFLRELEGRPKRWH